MAGDADAAMALHRAYGPAFPAPLLPLVAELRRRPSTSVEYTQEHLYTTARPAA
jgi:hypothetical protein